MKQKTCEDIIWQGSHAAKTRESFAAKLLFFIPLGIWITLYLLFHRTECANMVDHHVLQFAVCGLCVICLAIREILFGVWQKKTIFAFVLAVLCCALLALSKWNYLATAVLFIFVARNLSLDSIIKFTLPLLTIVWLLIIVLALCGVIPNLPIEERGHIRQSLGFLHPNILAGFYFFIVCQYVYLRRYRMGIAEFVLLLLVAIGLYALTISRTSIIITIAVILIAFVLKYMPAKMFNNRVCGVVTASLCVLLAVASVLLCVFYDYRVSWMYELNSLLSGRLCYGHYYVSNFGLSLLGQDANLEADIFINPYTGQAAQNAVAGALDFAAAHMVMRAGILFAVIAIVLSALSCWWACKHHKGFLAVLVVLMFVYGLSEKYALFIYFNPFIFAIGSMFGVDWLARAKKRGQNVKLCIAAHKPYWTPKDNLYIPVQVNAANTKEHIAGFQPDSEGDNISTENPRYCELTALYWAWKNLDVDAIGLVHYRRHFFGTGEKNTLLHEEAATLLEQAPVVVMKKRRYYIESIESHYGHTFDPTQIVALREALKETHPEYLDTFNMRMKKRSAHIFNMFIMRKDLLDAYCTFMFEVLRATEAKIDFSEMDAFQARVMGRLSERLLDTWLSYNKIDYVECPLISLEHVNWFKKGGSFLMAKVFKKKYKASF